MRMPVPIQRFKGVVILSSSVGAGDGRMNEVYFALKRLSASETPLNNFQTDLGVK